MQGWLGEEIQQILQRFIEYVADNDHWETYGSNCNNSFYYHSGTSYLHKVTWPGTKVMCKIMSTALFFLTDPSGLLHFTQGTDARVQKLREFIACTIVNTFMHILEETVCEGHWGIQYAWHVMRQEMDGTPTNIITTEECVEGFIDDVKLGHWSMKAKIKQWIKQKTDLRAWVQDTAIKTMCPKNADKIHRKEKGNWQARGENTDNYGETEVREKMETGIKDVIGSGMQEIMKKVGEHLEGRGKPPQTGQPGTGARQPGSGTHAAAGPNAPTTKPGGAQHDSKNETRSDEDDTHGGKKPEAPPVKQPKAPTNAVTETNDKKEHGSKDPKNKHQVPPSATSAAQTPEGTSATSGGASVGRNDPTTSETTPVTTTVTPTPAPPAAPAGGDSSGQDQSSGGTSTDQVAHNKGKCTQGPQVFKETNTGMGISGATSSIVLSFAPTSENDDDCDKKPQDPQEGTGNTPDTTGNGQEDSRPAPAAPQPAAAAPTSTPHSTHTDALSPVAAGATSAAGGAAAAGDAAPTPGPSADVTPAGGTHTDQTTEHVNRVPASPDGHTAQPQGTPATGIDTTHTDPHTTRVVDAGNDDPPPLNPPKPKPNPDPDQAGSSGSAEGGTGNDQTSVSSGGSAPSPPAGAGGGGTCSKSGSPTINRDDKPGLDLNFGIYSVGVGGSYGPYGKPESPVGTTDAPDGDFTTPVITAKDIFLSSPVLMFFESVTSLILPFFLGKASTLGTSSTNGTSQYGITDASTTVSLSDGTDVGTRGKRNFYGGRVTGSPVKNTLFDDMRRKFKPKVHVKNPGPVKKRPQVGTAKNKLKECCQKLKRCKMGRKAWLALILVLSVIYPLLLSDVGATMLPAMFYVMVGPFTFTQFMRRYGPSMLIPIIYSCVLVCFCRSKTGKCLLDKIWKKKEKEEAPTETETKGVNEESKNT
ncbi:hypothetical protein AK88_02180 [Plasmodium fragile]|uniref:Schizont-infected cell agglutination extracellular alpha domain-containing protein n=1 Tax=Plasmodium fragile TaxID=5857 RepID=A0A0D9QMT2_PLAFR|nr:uncharacterized protein AK88_02180 [Plasmodium fragile]KJP88233.1 hypothetical protein AK88_02180 [Plasmodium fragile]